MTGSTDAALLLIRVCLGVVLLAHAWNHALGGGRIAGTADWFEGLGLRPGVVHAWASVVTEVAAGAGLILGLLTPLACAAAIGVMCVAFVTVHLPHGFFIFREGYEYVAVIAIVSAAVGIAGPGGISADAALGLDLSGWTGFALSTVPGVLGAALTLGFAWRPNRG
ncbi:DoxX family protein [Actinocorallia sp. B10E7]|uniref:DoxX family protein n=1 Tax=Actinocorallia sp. B10E7 TaxID=3153558 RepID=UPI00325F25C6